MISENRKKLKTQAYLAKKIRIYNQVKIKFMEQIFDL